MNSEPFSYVDNHFKVTYNKPMNLSKLYIITLLALLCSCRTSIPHCTPKDATATVVSVSRSIKHSELYIRLDGIGTHHGFVQSGLMVKENVKAGDAIPVQYCTDGDRIVIVNFDTQKYLEIQ